MRNRANLSMNGDTPQNLSLSKIEISELIK